MKHIPILAAAICAVSVAAAAADQAPIVSEATASYSYGGDWTGPYAGLQVGRLDADLAGDADGDGDDDAADDFPSDGAIYGGFVGYDYDFGRFVLGGEVDYNASDLDFGGIAELDTLTRLKLRGGYDLGRTMIYATAGAALVDTSIGDETGAFGGFGVAYSVNGQVTLGGEILHHEFDDLGGTGIGAEATTLSVRAGFRF